MRCAKATCRLAEALALRMCGWCTSECIREGLEDRGECRHVVRDAAMAVIAGYAWLPPPSLDTEPAVVLEWATRSLYYSSVAPLLASRRGSKLVASRALFTRRLVERLLHDYSLVTGYVIYATDYRLPGGWVTHPTLARCPGGGASTRVEATGPLSMRIIHECNSVRVELELEPPRVEGCRGILETLGRVAEHGC